MQVFIKIRFKLIHFKQCGVPIYNPMSIYMHIDLPDNNCCLVSLAIPLPYPFSGFNSLTVLFKRTESHELSWSTAWNWQFYEHTLYLCSDYLIMRFPERRHWQDTYFSFLSLNHLLFCLGFCLPHIIYKMTRMSYEKQHETGPQLLQFPY